MNALCLLLICVWVLKGCTSGTISSAGCGVQKVCFSQPVDCDPAVDPSCYFMASTPSPTGSEITVELQGRAEGYVSFGFSDDQRMGDDDIYICGTDSNGTVQVQHAYSTGRNRPTIIPLGNVSDIAASVMDGVISCSFILRNPISTVRTSGENNTFFLLFAYGSSTDGKIRYHGGNRFVSDAKVNLMDPQIIRHWRHPPIIRAHGCLMLIAWMSTASVGMITARYLKAVAKGKGCCGKDFWFSAHVSLMSLSIVLTSIAFILVFVHVRHWSGGAHPVLGCLVMILSLIQPIAAAFRCVPQHERRYIFNWAHALNAVVIKVLAVAAIFTGLSWVDSSQDKWLLKVMGGFIGWEALFFILQEIHMWWKKKDVGGSAVGLVGRIEVVLLVLFFLGNLTFLVALLTGIGLA